MSDVILKVNTSEPRDALQLERTCLSFIRFATTLFVTAFGVILNFKLRSLGDPEPPLGHFLPSKYSRIVSYILIVFAAFVLIVSAISYLITIKRYQLGKIRNFGFNNVFSSVVVMLIVGLLVGINIALIVEGYENRQ